MQGAPAGPGLQGPVEEAGHGEVGAAFTSLLRAGSRSLGETGLPPFFFFFLLVGFIFEHTLRWFLAYLQICVVITIEHLLT